MMGKCGTILNGFRLKYERSRSFGYSNDNDGGEDFEDDYKSLSNLIMWTNLETPVKWSRSEN